MSSPSTTVARPNQSTYHLLKRTIAEDPCTAFQSKRIRTVFEHTSLKGGFVPEPNPGRHAAEAAHENSRLLAPKPDPAGFASHMRTYTKSKRAPPVRKSDPLFGSYKPSELGPKNPKIRTCTDPLCGINLALPELRRRQRHYTTLVAFYTQCVDIGMQRVSTHTGPSRVLAELPPHRPGCTGEFMAPIIQTTAEVEVSIWDGDGHQLYVCGHPKCVEEEEGHFMSFREKICGSDTSSRYISRRSTPM